MRSSASERMCADCLKSYVIGLFPSDCKPESISGMKKPSISSARRIASPWSAGLRILNGRGNDRGYCGWCLDLDPGIGEQINRAGHSREFGELRQTAVAEPDNMDGCSGGTGLPCCGLPAGVDARFGAGC